MKNKTTKIISIVVIALLVLIVVAAVLINLFGDAALKAGIETGATSALGVDVGVQDVSLGIFAGKLNISDLVVDNPEGYANPTFLELGHGFVHLNTSSLMSDTVEIETIRLDNVHLTIEQKGLTSNLSEIMGNLPKTEAPKEEKPGKELLVKQLDIEGVTVTVNLLPVPGRADNLTLDLAPIHMENIGSGQQMNTPLLVSKIIVAIAEGVARKGTDILPTDMIKNLSGQLSEQGQKILEAGQNIGGEILEGGKDVGGGMIEGGKDVGEKATETLKDLNPFRKKEETETQE